MRHWLLSSVAAALFAALGTAAPAGALTLQLPDAGSPDAGASVGDADHKTSFSAQPINNGQPGLSWDLGDAGKIGFSVRAGSTAPGMFFGPGGSTMFAAPGGALPPGFRTDLSH